MYEETTLQWVIRADGSGMGRVSPSHSVEIGRKPLRPLADDGMSRIDVPDETRSMSKRHAVFSVSENGAANVRDMASTNGTYVVRDDGGLMRLPQSVDFLLPTSPVRMQFGDVPVDFTRVEQEAPEEPQPAVPDLFDYAVGEGRQEPDAADMSVDDILDLRAGEPTSMFQADSVKHRAQELDAAQHQTFEPFPFEQAAVPLTIMPETEQEGAPRDLFEDAQSAGVDAENLHLDEEPVDDNPTAPQRVDSVWTLVAEQQDGQAESEPASEPQSASEEQAVPDTQPAVEEARPSKEPADDPAAGAPLVFTAMTADQPSSMPDLDREPAAREEPASTEPAHEESESAGIAESFTPAFEPGSVFERVSQGGFAPPEPAVQIDGMTSDDAKRTTDFTMQFEMARHPQLLPFLAMNPSLYDDLYAWLAAQGNQDIDEALSRNEGYQEYRRAVGK